jgi:hypothetical protein
LEENKRDWITPDFRIKAFTIGILLIDWGLIVAEVIVVGRNLKVNLRVKDTIAVGTIAGLIATIQISIINIIFSALGFTITPGWKPFAELFFPAYSHTQLGFCVGLLGQIRISSVWGVLIAYILKYTGKDYWWLKGLGVGALSWIITAGAALRMFDIAKQVYHRPADQIMVPLNLFLFGFIVAYLIKRFGAFEDKWHS